MSSLLTANLITIGQQTIPQPRILKSCNIMVSYKVNLQTYIGMQFIDMLYVEIECSTIQVKPLPNCMAEVEHGC